MPTLVRTRRTNFYDVFILGRRFTVKKFQSTSSASRIKIYFKKSANKASKWIFTTLSVRELIAS